MISAEIKNKLKGCLTGGAIGDVLGGKYEGSYSNKFISYEFEWAISDDTQLTLATCEAIFSSAEINPETIAANFLKWFNARRLTGLGSSTLKALKELQVGGHWALVGRSGEYGAGNGAAMRIAPLAFKKGIDRQLIHDICSITHKNDEAYVGALAVYYSITNAINGNWKGESDLIEIILEELPDTLVKDRLLKFNNLKNTSITEIGQKFKPTGYVVDSVPIAIFAAQKIASSDFEEILKELIQVGGDTDTICSITGQIIGSLIGYDAIPSHLKSKYKTLQINELIIYLVEHWEEENGLPMK